MNRVVWHGRIYWLNELDFTKWAGYMDDWNTAYKPYDIDEQMVEDFLRSKEQLVF